jgi:two-component system OmpR family response regulator
MVNNNSARILVADDEPVSRQLLLRTLSAAGFNCRESRDGKEALEMLHAEIPSRLLLDFGMPRLNGAEVLKRLAGGRESGDCAIAYDHAHRPRS